MMLLTLCVLQKVGNTVQIRVEKGKRRKIIGRVDQRQSQRIQNPYSVSSNLTLPKDKIGCRMAEWRK